METKQIQEAVEGLGRAFEEFKAANDQRVAALEKGAPDPLLEEKVAKISTTLDEKQARIDAVSKELESVAKASARRAPSVDANGDDLDVKARNWAASIAKGRGVQAPEQFGAAEMKEYGEAFVSMMRKGRPAEEMYTKALSVGTDQDGGYVVTPQTDGRIVTKVFESSPMRQVAAQQTIGTDSLEGLFDLDEASANWVAETAARTDTGTPELAKWRIPVHELYAFPKATQKVLDDAMIDLESWLAAKVADKFARTENAAFVNGDGEGKPRGFLTYAAGTTIPGTIEQKVTGASGAFAAAPAGGDILLDMVYGTKQVYRSGARWHMNRSVLSAVRKLKNSDGDYLWAPGLAVGQPATLLGYSILEFEDMPDLGADSLSIAFANMGEAYQIVDRQGIRVLRDPFTAKPYVGFYTVKRTGGAVLNFEAIKLLKFGS